MSTEWHELADGRQRLRPDGIVEMRHSATTQTLESIQMQMEHAEQLLQGRGPAPMLVIMGEAKGQTSEARRFLTSDPKVARLITRVALVEGSPVSRVLTAFFLNLTRTPVPVRVFKSEDQAVPWLKEGL